MENNDEGESIKLIKEKQYRKSMDPKADYSKKKYNWQTSSKIKIGRRPE